MWSAHSKVCKAHQDHITTRLVCRAHLCTCSVLSHLWCASHLVWFAHHILYSAYFSTCGKITRNTMHTYHFSTVSRCNSHLYTTPELEKIIYKRLQKGIDWYHGRVHGDQVWVLHKDCILLLKSTFTGQVKNRHIHRSKEIREMFKRLKKIKVQNKAQV